MRFTHFFSRFFDPKFIEQSLKLVQTLILEDKHELAARELTGFSQMLRRALEPIADLDRPSNIHYSNIDSEGPINLGSLDINPNFVFNSISVIQSLILAGNSSQASSNLRKFSALIQDILKNTDKDMVSLSSEIALTENYIALQLVRFGNSFKHFIELSPAVKSNAALVPKQILQALVEHCIEQGTRKLNNGMIHVGIQQQERTLLCSVSYNGKSLQEPMNTDVGENEGLSEIFRRLQVIDRDDWALRRESLREEELFGENIFLQLPLVSKNPIN